VNQLADVKADRGNPGFALLAHGGIARRVAWAAALALGAAPFAAAALTRSWPPAAFAAGALLLGAVYSLRPVRLSGRPFADFLANAAGYGVLAFGMGWWVAGAPRSAEFARAAAPYFLLMCGGSISSTIPDMEGDRGDGKRTTAVALGALPAHVLATVLVAAGAIAGAVGGDRLALFCGAAALPLYLVHLSVRRTATMEACYKVGGAAAMLAAAAVEPVLAVAGLLTYLATRWYFRARFGVSYPSLVPIGHA